MNTAITQFEANDGISEMGAGVSNSDILRQKCEMEALVGSWDDSRTASEIITDIQAARMAGSRPTEN